MEYNLIENLEACRSVFQSASGLILYTHIPPVVLCLLFALYLLSQQRTTISKLLASIALVFSAWVAIDLFLWIRVDMNSMIMFLWSLLGILSALLFFLTYWFVYTFTTGSSSLPRWSLILWLLLLSPVIVLTPTTHNLLNFDLVNCAASEGQWFTNYYYALGIVSMVLMLVSYISYTRRCKQGEREKRGALLVLIGAELFLAAFVLTGALASYLVDNGILPDFGVDQYGLASMAVFIALLVYATVEYKAFQIQLLGVQALVTGLILLTGAEYLFAASTTSKWLITLTLVLTIFFGVILIRSVKREIEQRMKIEILAQDLEKANKQQVTLIHFITHQLKGFVAKSRNIFSMIQDGDFGSVPESMKPLIDEGFKSSTKGAQTIQEILNAANIKSGAVTYANLPFDLKTIVASVVGTLHHNADEKNVALTVTEPEEAVMVTGDQMQMENAIKNLVDNAIKYTPQGSVAITISKTPTTVLFETKDTGVGITEEDMQHLFTEGGHGAESQKVNVDSTGFGLYIVKNIIEAHQGTVRVESEGKGKGAHFIVELPTSV